MNAAVVDELGDTVDDFVDGGVDIAKDEGVDILNDGLGLDVG